MYLKLDQNNFISVISTDFFEGSIEAPNPSDDVITWFATKKYKFVNNQYIDVGQTWSAPEISPQDEL
jgi:hypothetical protein